MCARAVEHETMIDSSQHTSTIHMHCCAEGLALQCLLFRNGARTKEITSTIHMHCWAEGLALQCLLFRNGARTKEIKKK